MPEGADSTAIIVDLWTTASGQYHELWVLFALVAFGILGFCFSDAYSKTKPSTQACLALGYLTFVAANLISLTQNLTRQNLLLLDFLRSRWASAATTLVEEEQLRLILASMATPPPWAVYSLHTVITLGVFTALAVGRKRRAKTSTASSSP